MNSDKLQILLACLPDAPFKNQLTDVIGELIKERDMALWKLKHLEDTDAKYSMYQVGLSQEREITALTKERDSLRKALDEDLADRVLLADQVIALELANKDLTNWFDALKADHDKLKAAAKLALDELDWMIENYADRTTIKAAKALRNTGVE